MAAPASTALLRTAQGLTRLHGGAALHRPHEASWRFRRSQGITALLRTPRRSPCIAQLSFGNKADSGNSFGNSFGNKIFPEQLCFSIDSSVSSLLLPMLPKNPQKVSGIEKVYAISLQGKV